MAAELHLAENALALHLFLQRLEGLIDIVIADENLHAAPLSVDRNWNSGRGRRRHKGLATSGLSAPMYQNKAPMSTGVKRRRRSEIRRVVPGQVASGRNGPTCVTCPILRPGRVSPLPYRWTAAPGTVSQRA